MTSVTGMGVGFRGQAGAGGGARVVHMAALRADL